MSYIQSSESHPTSEALSVSNNKLFEVIQLADSNGNIIDPASSNLTLNGDVTISSEVEISNDSGNPVPVNGTVNVLAGLQIPPHDAINLGYTGSNLTTVEYKTGGSSGTVVATLTLAYDVDNNLTSIVKS
jgi:hypothetical protein